VKLNARSDTQCLTGIRGTINHSIYDLKDIWLLPGLRDPVGRIVVRRQQGKSQQQLGAPPRIKFFLLLGFILWINLTSSALL